jgi:GntP family gluconate:H+ symporter
VAEPLINPWLILGAGVATIVVLIVVVRVNAFLALIAAALVVSLLGPGAAAEKGARVAAAFGSAAGSIGIVIALASVIGRAMMESGAADRVVRAFLRTLGEKRGDVAMMGSGFVLSVPVFYDTVFYLLLPLARSMTRRVGRHYVRHLMAIAAGAAATHALVPPTPGPLAVAANLHIDLGTMILVGLVVAAPAALVGLLVSAWVDRRLGIAYRPLPGVEVEPTPIADDRLPSLGLSLLPIVLPIVLISGNTVVSMLAARGVAVPVSLSSFAGLAGDANVALLASAIVALGLVYWKRRLGRDQMAELVEQSLMSGGVIILITAAGGAFGAMLRVSSVGSAVEALFRSGGATGGLSLLLLGAAMSTLFKVAQGSSTVAMLTTSAMVAAMVPAGAALGFHPVYLALSISSASLVGTWMNDSGFWIFSKMGNLSEGETLKTWSVLSSSVGLAGVVATILLALVFPMAPAVAP